MPHALRLARFKTGRYAMLLFLYFDGDKIKIESISFQCFMSPIAMLFLLNFVHVAICRFV